jgi:hypothetical protein
MRTFLLATLAFIFFAAMLTLILLPPGVADQYLTFLHH